MSFVKAPTSLFPGYTSDGTNITIPIAALQGLTAAEAHTSTGDWRQIVLAFLSSLYSHYAGLATADKPQALVVNAPLVQAITTGVLAGSFKTQYDVICYNDYAIPNVADEPTV